LPCLSDDRDFIRVANHTFDFLVVRLDDGNLGFSPFAVGVMSSVRMANKLLIHTVNKTVDVKVKFFVDSVGNLVVDFGEFQRDLSIFAMLSAMGKTVQFAYSYRVFHQ